VNRCSKQSIDDMDLDEHGGDKARGTFVGTPLYVSPEMLNANQSGPYTDLWALGCILYQCLTGDVPFRANFDY
jgi:serine/threonine protein kinase